jgi:eukaryotic-like serine/threonine-protein kinase
LDTIFFKAAHASGLIGPQQWEYFLRLLRFRCAAEPEQPVPLARQDAILRAILIEQKSITEYQAQQMSEGRHKFKLGPYIITDFIAQGGMGQVYKAMHHIMGRECAVKVVPSGKATPDAVAGFNREIRLQAKLDCPYLVRAYDAGQDGTVHYLVTEYVPGMDLRRLIKAQGPLPQEQAARIVMQAAYGLEYAHQQGMVHRDVKPGNILVTPDGLAKVSDVGLAGIAANLIDDPRAGKIVGTADYLSPEQIRTPLQVGPVSDVYSLGCTLYYAVCGKVPFPGGDTSQKVRKHLDETPFHPRRFVPNINEEFVEIIAEMMDKNPKSRTQSCAEVAARLEPWATMSAELQQPRMSRGPWTAPPPPSMETDPGVVPDEVTQETSIHSNESSGKGVLPESLGTLAGTQSQMNFDPTGHPALAARDENAPSTSTAMIIAMTAAVLLPPAIVLGAIFGYLFAKS